MIPIRTRLKRGEHSKATAKEAVDSLLNVMGFDPAKYALFDVWERETKGMARGCEVVAVQGKRLCVRVPSVVHRQELFYAKDQIIKRLNQAMGHKAITDIKFELDSDKGGAISAEYPRGKRNRVTGEKYG